MASSTTRSRPASASSTSPSATRRCSRPTTRPCSASAGGVIATWWVGLILGLLLIPAARFGRRPKRSARSLVRPVVALMVVAAVTASAAGVLGSVLAKGGGLALQGELAAKVPAAKQPAYIACLFAHNASYFVGFVGGGVLIAAIWAGRRTGRVSPQRAQRATDRKAEEKSFTAEGAEGAEKERNG